MLPSLLLAARLATHPTNINPIATQFCTSPAATRAERWQSIAPQVSKLMQPIITRRVTLQMAHKLSEQQANTLNHQDQLRIIDAIAARAKQLCPTK
jgi:hypothetical protein